MKVKIRLDELGDVVNIYLYEKRGGNGDIYIAKSIDLVFTKRETGMIAKPTLRLPLYGGDGEILQSLAEELDKMNVKTDKDAKIQGTLEATRYHLEDLRRLLKLNKISIRR